MRRTSISLILVLASCGSDDGGNGKTLHPGDNVQAALIAAKSGDTLVFEPGTYTFTDELSLSTSGVTLRGNGTTQDQVVFNFAGQAEGGNGLNVTGGDFVVENLTVLDTPGDGIRVSGATNVTFRKVTVKWTAGSVTENGAYGLYPVSSTNVLVEDSVVQGASDACIYVGQSKNAMVRRNTVTGCQTGIEIENTTDAEVTQNHAEDNVTGILVFNLPNLVEKSGSRTLVHDNMILNNNRATFAVPGSVVYYVPPGEGMLLLANDFTEIKSNTISGNHSLGIAMVSCSTAELTTEGAIDCSDNLYDGFAEGLFVHDNTFSGNGTDPQGFYGLLAQGHGLPDMLWDGVKNPAKPDTDGTLKLCIKGNGSATFAMVDVANVALGSTDLSPYDCTHTPLSGVTVTWGQ